MPVITKAKADTSLPDSFGLWTRSGHYYSRSAEPQRLGIFYEAGRRLRHLALYTPYAGPPIRSLCGWYPSSWVASADTQNPCAECLRAMTQSITSEPP